MGLLTRVLSLFCNKQEKSVTQQKYQKGRKVATAINLLQSVDGKISLHNLKRLIEEAGYGGDELSRSNLDKIVKAASNDGMTVTALKTRNVNINETDEEDVLKHMYGVIHYANKVFIITSD